MKTEQIEWLSKLGILSSLRTQLECLYKTDLYHTPILAADTFVLGRIYQLEQIIEEIERT